MLVRAIVPHKSGKKIYAVGSQYDETEANALQKIKMGICVKVEAKAIERAPENKSHKKVKTKSKSAVEAK